MATSDSEEVRISARAPFVGRDGELDLLLGAVALVPSAGLTAVVVSGEAGIGKSRLLAEAADRLSGRGWRVLRVRADRLERQVPYGALGNALRGVSADNSFTEGLRRDALAALELSVSAAAAEALGSTSPEALGSTSPGALGFTSPGALGSTSPEALGSTSPEALGSTSPEATNVASFGRACATVARLLTALSGASPLALAVDDLHELDDDSLALLGVVLHRLSSAPIGLVVALRSHVAEPNAAAHELLDRLAESVDVVHVDLGTLSRVDLSAVVVSALGAVPDDDLIGEVHRRADGNPYFAGEIAQSLVDSQMVVVDGNRAHLTVAPHAVRLTRRSAVLRRVLPLSLDARAVARTFAVLRLAGLERMGLIAQVAALADVAVAAAFDDLVRAHVVVNDPEHGYRFSHDIVADAVYDEIGPAERRRLHRLVADRLLTDRGQDAAVDLLELAWHLSESAVPGDALAIQVLTEAAQHALSSAPEAAADFCARALLLLKVGAPERPGLLALQCRALTRASRPAVAVAPGREALALLPPGEERFRTATAVLSSLFSLGRIDEAIQVADEQVRSRGVPAALHAQRAVLLVFANRTAEALDEAALASSTPPVSPAEEVVVCGQLGMLTSMLFRHTETIEYADRAERASGSSITLQLQALGVAASTEALAGLLPEAARRLRRAELLTQEADGRQLFWGELGVARVVVDWLGGRWDSALEAMRAMTTELAARHQSTLASALTAAELEIRTWRGELVLAASLAARTGPSARNVASLHAWALAGFQGARGDTDGARATLLAAAEGPGTPTYIGLLLSRLAELELEHGRPEDARRTLQKLIDATSAHISPWSMTTLHRTVGLVRGDVDALAVAVREADAGGLVFEQARAQLVLGGLDPTAVAGLVEAHQTFSRLGAHGLRRLAARRLRKLGAKVPRARRRAAGLLTESEEHVARLVQQGMRNREIATALHFSPRSVEVYLSRIYAKLRVSSRLELARALDAMDVPGR